MNQESKPLGSAKAHLLRFLNKEVAIPKTLREYRKTLLSLFEDLKVEISQEVAQITDILEIEAYFVELDEQICSSETSLKEEIDAAQQEEDAYPYSRTLTQILRQEGVVEFDIHDLSRHPDRSMELRRIEHYHGEFQEEAYTYLISFFDDFILQRINERRNDTLDACLYRRFEYSFYESFCNYQSINNEEEFEAFETFQ